MFSDSAVTFIRAIPGQGAVLRTLLEHDAMQECSDMPQRAEILTCDVDADFICLKETHDTGFIFMSDETKCCIASLMVVMGGDVNEALFH